MNRATFTDVNERFDWMVYQVFVLGKPIWSIVQYFTTAEFYDASKLDRWLLLKLDCVRWEATRLARMASDDPEVNVRLTITSAYRPDDKDSEHGQDPYVGVDVRCKKSRNRYYIVRACFTLGITRIGIYCDDDHVHLGVGQLTDPTKFPGNVMWIRECKDEDDE